VPQVTRGPREIISRYGCLSRLSRGFETPCSSGERRLFLCKPQRQHRGIEAPGSTDHQRWNLSFFGQSIDAPGGFPKKRCNIADREQAASRFKRQEDVEHLRRFRRRFFVRIGALWGKLHLGRDGVVVAAGAARFVHADSPKGRLCEPCHNFANLHGKGLMTMLPAVMTMPHHRYASAKRVGRIKLDNKSRSPQNCGKGSFSV